MHVYRFAETQRHFQRLTTSSTDTHCLIRRRTFQPETEPAKHEHARDHHIIITNKRYVYIIWEKQSINERIHEM